MKSKGENQIDRRPRARLSDYFFIVIALVALMQTSLVFTHRGMLLGIGYVFVIVVASTLIAIENRGRFLPLFDKRH